MLKDLRTSFDATTSQAEDPGSILEGHGDSGMCPKHLALSVVWRSHSFLQTFTPHYRYVCVCVGVCVCQPLLLRVPFPFVFVHMQGASGRQANAG